MRLHLNIIIVASLVKLLTKISLETGPSGGEKYSTAFPVVCGLLVVVLCINLVGFILFMVRRRRNEATNETG